MIDFTATRFDTFVSSVKKNVKLPHAILYPCGMKSADFFVPKIEQIVKFQGAYKQNLSKNPDMLYLGFQQQEGQFVDVLCSCVTKHKDVLSLSFSNFALMFEALAGNTIFQSHVFFEHYYGITFLEHFEEFLIHTELFQHSNLTVHTL